MNCLKRTPAVCPGFTLVEVVISLAVSMMVMGGVISGYLMACRKAEWASYSMAAQQTANKRLEQVTSCSWIPDSGVDDLVVSNFPPSGEFLSLPTQQTNIFNATNFTFISTLSVSPPLKMIRIDCVWVFQGQLFSNSVATIHAPAS